MLSSIKSHLVFPSLLPVNFFSCVHECVISLYFTFAHSSNIRMKCAQNHFVIVNLGLYSNPQNKFFALNFHASDQEQG